MMNAQDPEPRGMLPLKGPLNAHKKADETFKQTARIMRRLISMRQRKGFDSYFVHAVVWAVLGLSSFGHLLARIGDMDRNQTSQPSQGLLDNLDPTQLRVPITVSWQMTTSRLLSSGTTTISQTYRETWVMEVSSSGEVDLKSPRGRSPIFVPGGMKVKFEIPKGFVIEEGDLARLVGIGSKFDKKINDDGDSGSRRLPIFINLARPPRGGTDLSISLSDVEHHEVHLDFGSGVGL